MRTDTIGWQAELLVRDILNREELNTAIHNSMADADDPTIGISLHGKGFRIPLPDLHITRRGGTLLTSMQQARTWYVEVKAKTCFGAFEMGKFLTTGFENWTLECYQRLAEECGQVVEVYFVHIFPLAEAKKVISPSAAPAGIYKADIQALYESRWRPPFNTNLAYWPVINSVLELVSPMEELLRSTDVKGRIEELQRIAKRDCKFDLGL
jgi:hypothetical protein